MATDIKIVIRGSDEFSKTFGALDGAFNAIARSGKRAAGGVSGMDQALSGLAGSTQGAGQMASMFAQGLGENFAMIMEAQQTALQDIAEQQELTTIELGERLLEVDQDFQESRQSQQDQANSRQRQGQATHLAALVDLQLSSQARLAAAEEAMLAARRERFTMFFTALSELAASQGRSMAALSKSLGISQALIDTYRAANNALASVPFPFNLAAAALVLAEGLANVQRIRQVGVAHAGLEFVPREQTFLLDRGERVLSAVQNRDLTDFLSSEGTKAAGGEVSIENLTIHVLENATSGDALLELDQEDMRQLVAERLIPALDELARLGIRPDFVENNT